MHDKTSGGISFQGPSNWKRSQEAVPCLGLEVSISIGPRIVSLHHTSIRVRTN